MKILYGLMCHEAQLEDEITKVELKYGKPAANILFNFMGRNSTP